VYMKGADFDIAKQAHRQPLDISCKCDMQRQKLSLLQLTSFSGKLVQVAEP